MTDSAAIAPVSARAMPRLLANPVLWVALLALATVWFYNSGPMGPDVSWLTTVSERILAGQTLYVDILETNPPVAGYLYLVPAWLGQFFQIPPEPLIIAMTVAFGLFTTGVSVGIVRKAKLVQRYDLLWPVTFVLVCAGWGEDFAQREHFATMSALPMIAVFAVRAQGLKPTTWQWLLAGVCGGFILTIKPHFAAAIIVPALYVVARRHSLWPVVKAPELWLAGALFLAFLALIWFAFPGFITNIMPAAAATYVPDRREPLLLLSLAIVQFFLALTAVGGLIYWRNIAGNALFGTIFFCAIGFFIAFFAQSRGYLYQILPATSLMGVFVVMGFASNSMGKDRLFGTAFAVACALVIASVPVKQEILNWQLRAPLYAAVAPYGPGLKIVNIVSDLTAGSPLHRVVHGELINSPPALLMSMSAIRLRKERNPTGEWAKQIDAVENGERAQLLADIKKQPPDIIVTSATGLDWFAWAKQDAEIAALLSDFEDFAVVPFGDYDLRLLKRKGLQPKT